MKEIERAVAVLMCASAAERGREPPLSVSNDGCAFMGGGLGGLGLFRSGKKQFGFEPNRLKSPNSWKNFAWIPLPLTWLRLPGHWAEFPPGLDRRSNLVSAMTVQGNFTLRKRHLHRDTVDWRSSWILVFIVLNIFGPLLGPGMPA